ncbi:MAG: hypothetical protein JWP44_1455, partial [Mucilaginibacter sp.]|nr:hypothetical protein [Mucilaginibacter sp.]
ISLAKKRNPGGNKVTFVNDAIENVSLTKNFDVIITPFLFDSFNEQTVQKVFEYIHTSLKTGGIWLNADFQLTGKWWQKSLLKLMLLFFKILCNIEASKLPDIEKRFQQHGYKVINQQTFFKNFISAKVYEKE